jgi:hypothetical protein
MANLARQLAIKGHPTRGKEVIEILEMLGGKNQRNYSGDSDDLYFYIINEQDTDIIVYDWVGDFIWDDEFLLILTLEEFLKKYPYKVGDKVLINSDMNDVYTIKSMEWNTDLECITYRLETIDGIVNYHYWFAEEMKRYLEQKEEIMEVNIDITLAPYLKGEDYSGRRIGYKIPNGYECECVNKNEIILKPIKPQYPKTYCECCDILGYKASYDLNNITTHDCVYDYKLQMLYRVLICRDAYWKIAGEEMGLKEPWKPDWTIDEYKYCLGTDKNTVINECFMTGNRILAFPTKKMRDIFYENFEDLIEECKEFL